MERLLQALDELDDLVTMLRHLWLIHAPAPRPVQPARTGAVAAALALPDAAAAV